MSDVRIIDKPLIQEAETGTEIFVVTPVDGSPALRRAPLSAFKSEIDGYIDDKIVALYDLSPVLAAEYDDSGETLYTNGDIVMHDGSLYRCTLPSGTGATGRDFAPQCWAQVTIGEWLRQLDQRESQHNSALSGRISDLEGQALKLAFVNTLPALGESDTVYVLDTGSGYELWWQPDGEEWERFGGDTSPSSSTVVVQALPQAGDADTDYILESGGTYRYYKWISDAWHLIGVDAYTKAEVDTRIVNGDKAVAELVNSSVGSVNGRLDTMSGAIAGLTTIVNGVSNFVEDISEAGTGVRVDYHDGSSKTVSTQDTSVKVVEVDELDGNAGVRVTYSDGTTKDLEIAGTGGGGASGTASIAYVGGSDIQVVRGDPCIIRYILTAKDASEDLVGNGTATWYVGGVRRATSVALNGQVSSFDVGDYLGIGSNTVRVSVSVDTGGEAPKVTTKVWTVAVINMYLTWDYDDTTINTASAVSLQWTPYGDLQKTTHILIDGVERADLSTTTSRSGVTQYVSMDKLSHGSHRVEMYLTGTVNSTAITSRSVVHDMIFADASSQVPVIASSLDTFAMVQYDTLRIPIVVYDPAGITATIILAEDGVEKETRTGVDRDVHYWNYTPATHGSHVLTITCGSTVKTLTIQVEQLDIDNEEIPGFSFRLKASDIAGNAALRAWESNGVTATFSSNFDWYNGGIQTELDDNGGVRQYICVKAGTRMTINHKLFADDATANGKNVKIVFKVTNCRTYDAQIASSYAENIGLRMYAHEARFRSTGTEVSTQYGEDSYIELEFDVYPAPTATNGSYRYIMAWVDGVIGVSRVYGSTDNFSQTQANQTDIVIGSDDCDVYIYMVKAYPSVISRNNHIVNFIADAPNAQEMMRRYSRNDILDSSGQHIDYQKLATQNPDCRVWLYDIPYMTNGKKDKVSNCAFRQFWHNGDQYYQLSGTCVMTVQGTSSVKYIRGAANTDENFKVLEDGYGNNLLAGGTEDEDYGNNWYLEDPENPGHAKVFDAEPDEELGPECIAVERDSERNVTKYIKALGFKISDDSCPITYANTKVNFASCEQVNNMCNAIWYQRFNPYPSLTPRDCMEFVMGVQFIRETGTPPDDSHFKLWDGPDVDPNKYYMYSIANMGNSKKNVHVFHDLSNPDEVCIEINDNDVPQMMMIDDDLSLEDWSGDVYFGMRYPDTKNPSAAVRSAWQRLVTWMATRNPNAATGDVLAQSETYGPYTFRGHDRAGTQVLRGTTISQYAGTYTHDTFERRMARMLSECEDYMVMDSFVYHFVYGERHTMVDNVAKNTFWSSADLLHWDLSKAYDMDTSDGNNNQGKMVFDYGNEWDDLQGNGQIVFNSAQSVWFVFVANLYEACRTMFTNREALGAWSASAYHAFLTEQQQKVPERVWSECYWYDYLRTQEQGISSEWITFLDGGQKTHQRHHYEYFEELYDSSKYRGTAATSQNVNFRAYTPATWAGVRPKAELTVTMYNKMYITVEVGTTALDPIRAERGVPVVVNFEQFGSPNNMVIAINAAPMIQAITGLEQLYPDTCVFSMATRLRELSIGSDATGYQNTFLTSLALENNRMLERLYAQNLVNVNSVLDLSGCQSLRYLDASGSGFTGYEFAVGGLLETAYIDTPASLSLRSLRYLLSTGFHVGSYAQLSTLRFEDTPGLDSLAIVNAATALTRLRLIGIDWTLAETAVLNRLLRIMGMSETGSNTAQSVLAGQAYVSGSVRNHELEEYSTAWPNLDVSYEAGNLIEQFLVTYVNADAGHTVLYTAYVDRGTTPPDPVALGYIQEPTLEPTAQYTYSFGSRQDGEYVTGSGWDGLAGGVTGPRTVYASYTETVRTYTVTWYSRLGLPLEQRQNVPYGSAVSYSGGIPTRSDGEQFYTWYLFKDWDRSTGRITGDTDVYAIWDTGTLPDTGTSLEDMTPAQIRAVGQMDMQDSYWDEGDYVDITLGHDHDYSNVEAIEIGRDVTLTGIAAETYQGIGYWFDGSHYCTTDIALFAEDSPSFTLALDMQLNCARSGETILSCQEGSVAEGFRIYYNGTNVLIQWGNMTQAIGANKQRDIVVIRHQKGSNYLYVYSSYQVSTRLSNADSYYPMLRANSTVSDEPLTFGAAHYPGNASNPYQGICSGTIHWCKIWLDDLGDAVAREMAVWPREIIRMEYWGKGKYYYSDTSGLCKASFVSNAIIGGIGGRGYWHQQTNTNEGGWEASLVREFLAGRFVRALPNEWQTLIRAVDISATAGQRSAEVVTGSDKITLLSACEMGSTDSAYTGELGPAAQPRVPWLTNNQARVKFKGLFRQYGSAITTYVTQAAPETLYQTDIPYGTIWADQSNSNIGHIFVPRALVAEYGINGAIEADTAYADGYWIPSPTWWSRSPSQANLANFLYANTSGAIGNNNASSAYGVVPAFSF